jgi:hypothetical protein
MKRLIFLKVAYHEKPDEAFKQFRSAIKEWPYIKLVKELPPKPQVIIEFPDDKYQELYENFLKVDIVFVIDPILPVGEV